MELDAPEEGPAPECGRVARGVAAPAGADVARFVSAARSLPPPDELHGPAEGQGPAKLERATATYTPLVRVRRGAACGAPSRPLRAALCNARILFDAPCAARAARRTSASA